MTEAEKKELLAALQAAGTQGPKQVQVSRGEGYGWPSPGETTGSGLGAKNLPAMLGVAAQAAPEYAGLAGEAATQQATQNYSNRDLVSDYFNRDRLNRANLDASALAGGRMGQEREIRAAQLRKMLIENTAASRALNKPSYGGVGMPDRSGPAMPSGPDYNRLQRSKDMALERSNQNAGLDYRAALLKDMMSGFNMRGTTTAEKSGSQDQLVNNAGSWQRVPLASSERTTQTQDFDPSYVLRALIENLGR
jgi:hypothetical protein